MEISTYVENSLTFKITNGEDDDYNAVGAFLDVLKKCRKEADKKGYRNLFNKNEKIFVREFTEELQNYLEYEDTDKD